MGPCYVFYLNFLSLPLLPIKPVRQMVQLGRRKLWSLSVHLVRIQSWNKEIREALKKPDHFLTFCLKIPSLPVAAETLLSSSKYQAQDLASIYSLKTIYFVFWSLVFSYIQDQFFHLLLRLFNQTFHSTFGLRVYHSFHMALSWRIPRKEYRLPAEAETKASPSPYFTWILSVQSPVFYRLKRLAQNYLNKCTVLLSNAVWTGIKFSLLKSVLDQEGHYPETCQNNQELSEHNWQKNRRIAVTTKAKDVLAILCIIVSNSS